MPYNIELQPNLQDVDVYLTIHSYSWICMKLMYTLQYKATAEHARWCVPYNLTIYSYSRTSKVTTLQCIVTAKPTRCWCIPYDMKLQLNLAKPTRCWCITSKVTTIQYSVTTKPTRRWCITSKVTTLQYIVTAKPTRCWRIPYDIKLHLKLLNIQDVDVYLTI